MRSGGWLWQACGVAVLSLTCASVGFVVVSIRIG